MYTYMVRCKDSSLYTGYTTDLDRRMKQHSSGNGSKYVSIKGFLKMEVAFRTSSKSEAMKLESYIKRRLSKKQKEDLILGDYSRIIKAGFDILEVIR